MALGNSTMTYDQLGSLAANLLHKAFIETTRTVSKGLYRRLEEGETVGVTRLEFEGDETVQLNMTLDTSQYRGDLNYSRFRDSIVAILQDLVENLSGEGPRSAGHKQVVNWCSWTDGTRQRYQRDHVHYDAVTQ